MTTHPTRSTGSIRANGALAVLSGAAPPGPGRSGRFAGLWMFCGLLALACPQAGMPQVETGAPDLKEATRIAEGEKVFTKACSIPYCHGREGAAGRAPALRDRRWAVSRLQQIIARGIPNTSMLNFDDKLSETELWAVVAYILSISGDAGMDASARPPSPDPARTRPPATGPASVSVPESLTGDPSRGEQLFFESSGGRGCGGCHSIDGKGTAVGPDLSGSFSREGRAIFSKIVFPAAGLQPGTGVMRITMKDGEQVLAMEQEKTETGVRVYDVGSFPPVLRRLQKEQIQTVEPTSLSAMPARFAELYTLKELLDIVSFVRSSGAAAPVRVSLPDVW